MFIKVHPSNKLGQTDCTVTLTFKRREPYLKLVHPVYILNLQTQISVYFDVC